MKKNIHLRKRLLALILILVLMVGAVPSAFAAEFKAYVKSDSMKVYAKKSLSSYLGKLSKYTVVTVEDYADGVARIRLNGNVGYAKVADMAATQAATVNANTLVYRSASTESMSLSVKKGTQVELIAVNGVWAMVERQGVTAYMKAEYLTVNKVEEEEEENPDDLLENAKDAYFNENTYVYWKKSTSGAKVSVKKGMIVKLLAVEDGWATVYNPSNGMTAYAKASKVSTGVAATATPELTQSPDDLLENAKDAVITKDTYVYWQPSTSAGKVKVKKGLEVRLMAVSGVWAMVCNPENGLIAYVNASHVKEVEEEPTPTPTPAATEEPEENREELLANAKDAVITKNTYVYWQPSTTAGKVSVKKGLAIKLLKVDGAWALVYNPAYNVYAYMNPSQVQVVEPTATPTVTPTPTPTPEPTATVTPEPTKNPNDLLANAQDAVITENTRVYWQPSLSADSVKVKKGMQVKLVSVEGVWAMVYNPANGLFAYMNSSQVATLESLATPTPTPTLSPEELLANAKDAVITEDTIVYKSANADYPMTKVSKGMQVKLVAVNGEWALVYNPAAGIFAYMNAAQVIALEDLVTPTPDPLAGYVVETFEATVVSSGAKLYETASTEAASTSVSLGVNVTVGAYNVSTNWAYVDVKGTKGFMQISALSRDEYASLGLGSTGATVNKLESRLLSLGYFDGVPGSSYSTYTRDAVARFQAACGLSTSGLADAGTQRILYSDGAPSAALLSKSFAKGDDGDDVQRVQLRLFALGYLSKSASVDGDYGSKTEKAVKLFQEANGISVTGTLDNATLRKLYTAGASSLPSGKTPGDVATVVTPEAGNQQNNATTISDGLKSTTETYDASMSAAEKLEYVIYCGQNQLGKPYVYGATGMSSFDCSGFTFYAFKQIKVTLPRTAYNQGYSDAYTKIESIGNLKRGDLVFFNTVSDSDSCDHVGIYLGAGYFIHASSGQGRVVVSNLSSGYYNTVFSWGRRVA